MPTELDVCIVTDLRYPGGTSTRLVEEVVAASDGGYAVGVLHLASPRLGTGAVVRPDVRRLFDDGVATLLLPGEAVRASLTVVNHPVVFTETLGGALPIETGAVVVVAGQVPADAAGVYYDPIQVDAHVRAALDCDPLWAPNSPIVRSALTDVTMAAADWVGVIDVDAWRRSAGVSDHLDLADAARASADDRLVIGRHSRPDRLKWPDDPDELRAVYPTDGSVRVKVLGGADAVADVVGGVPSAWEVLPFGSVDPREFLAGLDAFAYFHHPDLTEAFGRNILEALAVGIPVVLPHHFESVYGDACLYAEPNSALDVVRSLLGDPVARREHLERADRVVRERFGHEQHRSRLERLIGPPAVRVVGPQLRAVPVFELAPPRLRASYAAVLIVCLDTSREEVDSVLTAVDRQRRHVPGFIPVVAVTVSTPALADDLGVEVAVITSRQMWGDSVEPWTAYAQRRVRQIAANYEVDSILPQDLHAELSWIALQVRPSRRGLFEDDSVGT